MDIKHGGLAGSGEGKKTEGESQKIRLSGGRIQQLLPRRPATRRCDVSGGAEWWFMRVRVTNGLEHDDGNYSGRSLGWRGSESCSTFTS